MTGQPEHNYPHFCSMADALRSLGYKVINPAELDGGDKTKPWVEYMARDLPKLIRDADAVAVLPGWEGSKGAKLEVGVARMLRMPVVYASTLLPVPERAMETALRIVHGERGEAYGHPLDDYERTARIWSAILGAEVTAEQAILCMIGVKISRECNRGGRDNRVDIGGYAECLDLVAQERRRRTNKCREAQECR
jgi:hypothetical protein